MSKVSLKKNIIFNYLGQFYIMFIGIVMLPFYLKYLGAEAYGLVGFFTMLTSIMMLLDIGLTNTLSRETARLKDKPQGTLEIKLTLRSIETVILATTTIVFISIYFFSHWISIHWLQIEYLDLDTVVNCIKLMGFMLSIRWFIGLYYGIIVGFEQQVWLNIYKMIIYTLKFLGGLILVMYISNNIIDFFIYQLLVSVVELTTLSYKVYRNLPSDKFIYPSYRALKKILPFALSVAYTSVIWTIFTKFDKLLLSHYISLKDYGYFALVVAVSGAIMQFSGPISQAILPRMTHLLSEQKEGEMLLIYRRSTQFIAILISSVVGMVSAFSYELLFSWTGNLEASVWASPILFWYAIGNGIAIILSFQYYLQYAYGNLKYQIKFNTFFPLLALPFIFFGVIEYGAYGASIAWFTIQLIGFLFWSPFIHSRFAPGMHMKWLLKDILPAILVTIIYVVILKQANLDFEMFSRIQIFSILIIFGGFLLVLNSLTYPNTRAIILKKVMRNNV